MMDEVDLGSDASDEDYVPEGEDVVLPSEEESDGDAEDDVGAAEEGGRKRRKAGKRKSGKKTKIDAAVESEPEIATEEKPLTEVEEKKKADSLWADFLKDTDFKPNTKPAAAEKKVEEVKLKPKPEVAAEVKEVPADKTVTVTKVFEFAGEEVRVTKEVAADSTEAKLAQLPAISARKGTPNRGKGSSAGISSVLSQIGKKQKISTLEKSKLDWDRFKKDENIDEELQAFNKGKHGYLERQDFLQRADLRQFEIEKEIRASTRGHRL